MRNFCLEIANLGNSVTAVVPDGWHAFIAGKIKERFFRRSIRCVGIHTMPAGYFSFSLLTTRSRILFRINQALCKRSVEHVLDRLPQKPDLIYAHFVISGLLVSAWCKKNGVKLAVVSGESTYEKLLKLYNANVLEREIRSFDSIYFVSERNQAELAKVVGAKQLFGSLLPNAVNGDVFRPRNKEECREALGLPQDKTIGIFVGYFIDRKGPLRVLEAMKRVGETYGIFVGTGSQVPKGEQVLFSGSVENDDMPTWLAAADFFILPSFHEGRSNAVLEALACGLPMIVSDRDFNREFLNDECAIFVEPSSVEEIANAIKELLDQPEKRVEMGRLAREHSFNFSQKERARSFINSVEDTFVKTS